MLCEGPISQRLFRLLQNEHRLQQQYLRARGDFRFATGSDGTSSPEDDFSVTSSSSERSSNDYKISLCAELKTAGYCRFGDTCRYAHNYDELQLAKPRGKCNPKYKSRYCDKFSNTGFCKYGDKCQYIHYLLNDTIRKQRERRGVAMHINERPLESYQRSGRKWRDGGDLNATVDGFVEQLEKYSNVNEKWTPFSKQIWGFQIEERLNTSLPVLRPSIDPVSNEASLYELLFDKSKV